MSTREEWDQMSENERDRRLRQLLVLEKHVDTLSKMAAYEESKTIMVSHWRGLIITTAALVTAAIFLITTFKSAMIKFLGI